MTLWPTVNAVMVQSRRAPTPHQQDQTQDKQQVVEPGQDVLEAQPEVVPEHVEATDASRHGHRGLVAPEHYLDQPAVVQVDAEEGFRPALVQAVDTDPFPDQAPAITVDAPPIGDVGANAVARARSGALDAAAGQRGTQRRRGGPGPRHAPEHGELPRRGLAKLEECRVKGMSEGGGGDPQP